jgi:hypothetical protein
VGYNESSDLENSAAAMKDLLLGHVAAAEGVNERYQAIAETMARHAIVFSETMLDARAAFTVGNCEHPDSFWAVRYGYKYGAPNEPIGPRSTHARGVHALAITLHGELALAVMLGGTFSLSHRGSRTANGDFPLNPSFTYPRTLLKLPLPQPPLSVSGRQIWLKPQGTLS